MKLIFTKSLTASYVKSLEITPLKYLLRQKRTTKPVINYKTASYLFLKSIITI